MYLLYLLKQGKELKRFLHNLCWGIFIQKIFMEKYKKEIDNGEFWFNIRNHVPCNDCVCQWFYLLPSNHEINNLCRIIGVLLKSKKAL